MQPQQNLDLSPIVPIVAMTFSSRIIGRSNSIPWRLPSDLARFKRLTMGHPTIMGRKTWESIPLKFRPLPGRTNIVVTRQPGYTAHGGIAVSSFEDAYTVAMGAPGAEEIFVIGGGELYEKSLPFAKKMYITLVGAHDIEGDTFFPKIRTSDWKCIYATREEGLPSDEYPTLFSILERISS